MSKPAPRQSIRIIWKLTNLVLLAIGVFIPIVQDPIFGTINSLNILAVMLMLLPGVIFQAVSIPGKLPGLFLYVCGLISLISLMLYVILESIAIVLKGKKRKIRSLFLIILSGIGVFAVLFLWQEHLTQGAAIVVTALISSLILECVELFSR